jgi:hypothetical protein
VDQETQKYYDNYFSLFMTDGWKQLMEDFGGNVANINSVEATKDAEDLQFRKGQLNLLAHLLNLENIMTTNYEEATKAPEEDD